MLALAQSAFSALMILLSITTANVGAAQIIPRSKPPSLHSYDVTSIQAILPDPGHYQFQIVRIRGVVQSITEVPNWARCGFATAYKIRAEDESSGMTMIDLGPCIGKSGSTGPVLPETLVDGEQIDALIFVSFTNHPWESPNPPEGLIQELERFQ